MPFGKKRSTAKVAAIKLEIVGYIAKGYPRAEIRMLMEKGKFKVPSRTFDRYYVDVIQDESKELSRAGAEQLVKFVKRCEARIKESMIRYRNTQDVRFQDAAHRYERDLVDKLMDIGVIKKAPEEIKVDTEFKVSSKRVLEILAERDKLKKQKKKKATKERKKKK